MCCDLPFDNCEPRTQAQEILLFLEPSIFAPYTRVAGSSFVSLLQGETLLFGLVKQILESGLVNVLIFVHLCCLVCFIALLSFYLASVLCFCYLLLVF